MKVSSRVDYAISSLLIIAAEHKSGRPIPVKYIAEKEEIEVDYVEKLLVILKKANIVKSVRGVKGGYLLVNSPSETKMLDIVEAFEGDALELVCTREKGRRAKCVHLSGCRVRTFWNGLRDEIKNYMLNVTLQKILLTK